MSKCGHVILIRIQNTHSGVWWTVDRLANKSVVFIFLFLSFLLQLLKEILTESHKGNVTDSKCLLAVRINTLTT